MMKVLVSQENEQIGHKVFKSTGLYCAAAFSKIKYVEVKVYVGVEIHCFMPGNFTKIGIFLKSSLCEVILLARKCSI